MARFAVVLAAAIRPEVAIAVSTVVRRLDIFLSFAVWGIGLSMMGAYRNGAFADVTLVTIRRFARAHQLFKLHLDNRRQIEAIRFFDIARRHNVAFGVKLDRSMRCARSRHVRFAPIATGLIAARELTRRAIMYGPAVRYKMDFQDQRT
jgi:hypothetical protein